MGALFAGQLDYIYFFYGLGLFLLGAVCLSISRGGKLATPWWLLGAFAIAHGVAEWLHLYALVAGDSTPFAVFRKLVIATSFVLLLEFARRTHRILTGRTVGPWIYPALWVAVFGLAAIFGLDHLEFGARILIAVPAISWTAGLFLAAASRTEAVGGTHASRLARRWCAITFAVFGLAAGGVAPLAPFPGPWQSQAAFLAWSGVPIQLVRGLLVLAMALSVWALAISFDPKGRILRKKRLLFWVMAASLGAMLAGGWVLTEWLGKLHEKEIREEAEGSAAQVHDHLMDQVNGAAGAARAAAQLVAHIKVFEERTAQAQLDDIVDSIASASESWVVYVLDPAGTTIATSNRGWPESFMGKNYAARPYFQAARDGRPGHFIGLGLTSRVPGYYLSEPVKGPGGTIAGVAVVKLNLTSEQLGPSRTDQAFLVAPDGEVLVASRGGQELRRLWTGPQAAGAGAAGAGAAPAGAVPGVSRLDHDLATMERVSAGGQKTLAIRLPVAASGWSLVVLKSEPTRIANRLLGIVITLLLCIGMLGAFVALQRQFGAEAVVTEKHRQAVGRAREFARKADTDALTGVLNRLGFNGAYSREFERARRYKQPLSVVMLDLDHFKRVNDDHGHVAGDQVLMGVARLIEHHVRESDILARWGGEEFVVVAPMTGLGGAAALAEKLRAQLEQTPLGPAGPVTGSLGVAELLPGESMESLLHRADEALYRVKNGGRNALACAPADPADADGPGARPIRPGPATASRYADTGFGPIDQEHRALAEALEAFVSKVNAGKVPEVQLALEALLARAGAHFAHEERLMVALDYPLRQRHGENHALFVEDVRRFLQELRESGLTLGFRRWAVGRLLEWFQLHVLSHDVALGHFLSNAIENDPSKRAMVG